MGEAKVCVIVPAYNEEENIAQVISSLNECNPNWHVVVINDASKDETSKIAKRTGKACVVDLPCNLGIGGGVQTGFKYARAHDFDIAIQFDGDGQHIATEIPKIISPILKGEADFVIGSRFMDESEENFRSTRVRRIGIKFFEHLNSILIRQRVTDNTSGFRAYSKAAFHLLADCYPSDYPEPEAVILLGKNGFRLKEVGVKMRERVGGQSSITSLKSVYYMVKVTLSIVIAFLRPQLHR